MLLHDGRGGAIGKRTILQFGFDRSQIVFKLRNFLVQPLSFSRLVRGTYG